MNELIKIEDKEINIKDNTLQVVEYKGERIITSYDIARLHGKKVKRVNEQFERNKKRLKEGVDYFVVSIEEFTVAICDHTISNKSRHQSERLFTERGYLKLVKSFTDDLSWEIQDLLVDSYFRLKEVISSKDSLLLGIFKATGDIDKALAINAYETQYVKPLEVKVEKQSAYIEKAKPKVAFHDAVTQLSSTVDMDVAAKLLNFKGIGRNKLFGLLRDFKILDKYNRPYQQYVDKGWFKLVETSCVHTTTGDKLVNHKVVLFQKGLDNIHSILIKKGYECLGMISMEDDG